MPSEPEALPLAPEGPVAFGPYVLDPAQARVTRAGEVLALGGRPLQVLSLLAAHPGRLLKKDEVLDAVWGHRHVSESALKGAVNLLRLVLGDDAKAPLYVETVPRQGYRFTAPVQALQTPSAAAEVPCAPAAAHPAAHPGNLPPAGELLLGRAAEQAVLSTLLTQHRLATLTGLGGVGKTRLALATAAALPLDLPAGRWLLRLEDLSDPALVVPSLAQLLHLGEHAAGGAPALAQALAGQQLLLVLDNAEHLVDAVAELVAALLAAAPGVRLLVTSQRPLRLRSERVLPLAPLALPDNAADSAPLPDSYAAAQLLCARVGQLLIPWAPLPAEHADIAAICRALDGVPLALELAAARVPTLGLAGVRLRLDKRFALLTRGPRDAAARHRTLAAALDWTFDLLSSAERQALQYLAVFAGGFSIEDAEGLLGEDAALEHLEELRARSLVVADTTPQGLRLRLFDSVRRRALDGLAQDGRETPARLQHLRWMLQRLQDLRRTELFTPTLHWLPLLRPELDNLRAALRFGLAPGAPAEAAADAAALAAHSLHLWLRSGNRAEGWAWLQQALALQTAQPSLLPAATRVLLDDAHGQYASNSQLGEPRPALEALRRAIAAHTAAGDAVARYTAQACEFSLLNRVGFDVEGRSVVAAVGASLQADWPPFARRHHVRLQALLCRQQADWAGFLQGMEQCAQICREADAAFEGWQVTYTLAQALSLLGRDEEACQRCQAAVDGLRAQGLLREQLYLVATAAALHLRLGSARAHAQAVEALQLLVADDMVWWMADALPWAAWHAGRAADAHRLQAWADGLVAARGETRGPFFGRMREAMAQALAQTLAGLPADGSAPAGLSQAQAIDLALGPGTAALLACAGPAPAASASETRALRP
jgi:predicted ATPase/DNA-binding winged helix-turn-helix (wHTH) protein